jgi:hypothetical protein
MPSGLADRTCDIFEALTAVADLAGGGWPETARQAAVSLSLTAQENNPIGSLFLDIMLLFAEAKTNRMFSRTMAAGLNRFVDRPWGELRRGKEITEQWLARQFRPYDVSSRTLWIGEQSAKGYLFEDFEDVFKRYIPPSEIAALWAAAKPPDETGRQTNDAGKKSEGGDPLPCGNGVTCGPEDGAATA